jgi:cyclic lactone autoinducer peptide
VKQLLANIFAGIGAIAAGGESNACVMWYIDEPECPKSLIK